MYYKKRETDSVEFSGEYFLPDILLNSMTFKQVRLETKLAYGAILNAMIKAGQSDEDGNVYIEEGNTLMIDLLKILANKKVDSEKMQGYIDELIALDLCQVNNGKVYLKKVKGIL